MERDFRLSDYQLKTYTLIYLLTDEKILLLKRDAGKSDMAGKLTGLGGKIEPGENLIESARRECLEESGLHIHNPLFRGTFQWIDETHKICMTHIIFAREFSGELQEENREGILSWYLISEISELAELAQYQKMFLEFLLEDDSNFYTGIGEFREEELVDYIDTKGGTYA